MDNNTPSSNSDTTNIVTKKWYSPKTILFIVLVAILLFCIVRIVEINHTQTSTTSQTYTLTQNDDGTTVHVKQHDSISVSIPVDAGLSIAPQSSNPSVIQTQSAGYNSSQATYKGKFVASQPGETDLILAARPICKPKAACPQFVLNAFRAHIVVD